MDYRANVMNRKFLRIAGIIAFLALMSGCKPTEKNYKSAYDAALQKRKAAETLDVDLVMPGQKLQSLDGPNIQIVNGDSVYVMVKRVKALEEGNANISRPYKVAVSMYKMKTNCLALTNDLKERGYEAFGVTDADGNCYVIAGSFTSLPEAALFDKQFQKKEKSHIYSGLPSAPVIIESR